MATVPVGNTLALVDDEDDDLASRSWWLHRTAHLVYVKGSTVFGGPQVYMHRLIMERLLGRELGSREQVDHINGDGLDNRRSNLRLASARQNCQNRRMRSDNTSGRKGVYWTGHRWQAQIYVNGKGLRLGTFTDLDRAAAAYDRAAIEHFGEYALTNAMMLDVRLDGQVALM